MRPLNSAVTTSVSLMTVRACVLRSVALYTSALILHFKLQEVSSELFALVFKFGNLLVRVQIFHGRQLIVFGIKVSHEHSRIHPNFFLLGHFFNLFFKNAILAVSVCVQWLLFVLRWPPINVCVHGQELNLPGVIQANFFAISIYVFVFALRA